MSDAPTNHDPPGETPQEPVAIDPSVHSLSEAASILPALAEREVYLFHLHIPHANIAEHSPLLDCLSQAERSRAAEMAHRHRRQTHLLCRAVLRRLLAGCARVDPGELQFTRGPHGKPALMAHHAGSGVPSFNYSHSAEHAVLAFCCRAEIGVDAEAPQSRSMIPERIMQMIRRFFHPEEIAWFEERDPQHLPHLFPRFWTCKEAVVKARGDGIQSGLNRFAINPARALRGDRLHIQVTSPHPTPILVQTHTLKCGLTSATAVCSKKNVTFKLFTINMSRKTC